MLKEDLSNKNAEWYRVYSSSPLDSWHYYYYYHGAIRQIRAIEEAFKTGDFTPEAKRKVAITILKSWQTSKKHFKADLYVLNIEDLADDFAKKKKKITADDIRNDLENKRYTSKE